MLRERSRIPAPFASVLLSMAILAFGGMGSSPSEVAASNIGIDAEMNWIEIIWIVMSAACLTLRTLTPYPPVEEA